MSDLLTEYESSKTFRTRTFHLVLYPDNEAHLNCLEKIRNTCRYLAILHDKDVGKDGELLKAHYHVLVRFPQARWNTALSKEWGVEPRFLMACKDFQHDMRYLVHADNENKYQYDTEAVEGNLLDQFQKAMRNATPDEVGLDIINIIDSYDCWISVKIFAKHMAHLGLWSEFRRDYPIYKAIIIEHNSRYVNSYTRESHYYQVDGADWSDCPWPPLKD